MLALVPASSDAASRLIVRGAGYGHGVGLSQWGARGFAERGRSHEFILRHYYPGTKLGSTGGQDVSVLVQTAPSVVFSGATTARGIRRLLPANRYSITVARSGKMTLRSPTGRKLKRTTGSIELGGIGDGILLAGRSGHDVTDGRYRGDLEVRPHPGGGLDVVNRLDLEDYVKGVVAGESPSNWPMAALRAQAIVARSYAVTTGSRSSDYELFPDTRSQVYNGIAGERARTNEAVDSTNGEVVTYRNRPVITYYFSTSGGRTENVENVFEDAKPTPWLRSVTDPFEGASPKHTWVRRLSLDTVQRRLGDLVPGRFEQVRVLERGSSPRIVRAQLVGSDGRRTVSGPTLRRELSLPDTWATFTGIVARASKAKPVRSKPHDPPRGAEPVAIADSGVRAGVLRGRVVPAKAGRWVAVQRLNGRKWVNQFEAPTRTGGRYFARVRRPGVYRIQYRREAGPAVRVKERYR